MEKLTVKSRKLLLALALAALAFPFPGKAKAADAVSADFKDWDGYYKVKADFFVAAPPDLVWQVLTDYGHIPDFVPSMKESRVLVREPGSLYLEQQAEGGFLFFTKRAHLLLYVRETPDQLITFQDTDHQDFDIYWGSWSLEPKDGGVEVTYRLLVRPNFSAPLAGDILHGSSKDLMEAIRREILKRETEHDLQAASPTPAPDRSRAE